MKRIYIPTDTEKIFLLSRANGAAYQGDLLPAYRWDWPKNGWLTKRREAIKRLASDDDLELKEGKA